MEQEWWYEDNANYDSQRVKDLVASLQALIKDEQIIKSLQENASVFGFTYQGDIRLMIYIDECECECEDEDNMLDITCRLEGGSFGMEMLAHSKSVNNAESWEIDSVDNYDALWSWISAPTKLLHVGTR